MARCDLHIHSYFSGKTPHVKLLEPMDSYNTPEGIYKLGKERGLDFITIADHDSIEGCLYFLEKFPDKKDFFISEEVTTKVPGTKYPLHIGVYNIDEKIHREILYLRDNVFELVKFLKSENIFYVWNHPFFFLPPNESGFEIFEELLDLFDIVEVYNGALPDGLNNLTEDVFKFFNKKGICGSDSHSMYNIGMCYVEAEGKNVEEFLENIRNGSFRIKRSSISFLYVYREAMSIYLGYARDILWRNEAHRSWSLYKKVRNILGWTLWLPIFTAGSFIYVFLQFRMFYRNMPFYEKMFWGLRDKIDKKDCILV